MRHVELQRRELANAKSADEVGEGGEDLDFKDMTMCDHRLYGSEAFSTCGVEIHLRKTLTLTLNPNTIPFPSSSIWRQ